MRVSLGTDQAVEGIRREVKADDFSKAELVDKAKEAGISTDGDKPTLASRLSDHVERRRLPDPRVVDVEFPEGTPLGEAFITVATGSGGGRGLWYYHSDSPPTWVESDSPGLQQLLAEHFGCAQGAPDDLENTHWTQAGRPGVGPEDSK